MVTCRVESSIRVTGVHYWENAPNYLGYQHRHEFIIRAQIQVQNDDREVEFHQLQQLLSFLIHADYSLYPDAMIVDFGTRSCEMIARKLYTALEQEGLRVRRVSVFEDDENGAIIDDSDA